MASQCCRFRPRARGLGSSVVFVAENRMQFRSMKSSVQFTSCFFFLEHFFPTLDITQVCNTLCNIFAKHFIFVCIYFFFLTTKRNTVKFPCSTLPILPRESLVEHQEWTVFYENMKKVDYLPKLHLELDLMVTPQYQFPSHPYL